jgi:hypothetical protein
MTDTPVAITVTATDPDPGQTLTWTVVTPPEHGALSGTLPSVTYTPNAGYRGPDSFTYRATDCGLDSNEATVSIAVGDHPPTITCPADVIVEATGPEGAPATWPPATVTDSSSSPEITYSHPIGSTFALGSTTVTATAEDASGNEVTCTFVVVVKPANAAESPSEVEPTEDVASDGCGCRESPSRSKASPLALVVGLAAWVGRRRRRDTAR